MAHLSRTAACGWLFTLLALFLSGQGALQAQNSGVDIDKATGRNIRYITQDAMYLANEEWLLYACELPADQTDLGSSFNTDSYWYSRYNLGNLLMRSGMGIHIVHNPLFKQHVKMDKKPDGTPMWKSPKDFLHFKVRQFCARTGVPCRFDPENMNNPKAFPPKGVFPIFLEYASGSPRFVRAPRLDDFMTLRWNPDSLDRTIVPAALGQTLLKEILWSEDFFTGTHQGANGKTYLGNTKEWGNGFRGAILTAMSITKMVTLKSMLAYDPMSGNLGGVNPMGYDPMKGLRYFPHAIRPKLMMKPGMPPMPTGFEVVDKSSHLLDLASLLWGTSEFYFYSNPMVKDAFDAIFGDQGDHKTHGALFPLKPHMLAKGLSVVVFKDMMALHFNKSQGTFESVGYPGGKRSGNIVTSDAGMALVALSNLARRVNDAPAMLKKKVMMAINAQARFLRSRLQDSDGGFYNGYNIGEGPDESNRTLESQGLAIRGLLAAYAVTGNRDNKDAAFKGYDYLNHRFWNSDIGVYRSELGAAISTYTPKNVGATLGALRELALASRGIARKQVVNRIDKFFGATQTHHRQQLAEIDPTGEPIPPMAKLMKMKARLMKLMQTNPKKAMAMKMKMADVDHDGVPKPGMAGGKFGFAPVPAASFKLKTL